VLAVAVEDRKPPDVASLGFGEGGLERCAVPLVSVVFDDGRADGSSRGSCLVGAPVIDYDYLLDVGPYLRDDVGDGAFLVVRWDCDEAVRSPVVGHRRRRGHLIGWSIVGWVGRRYGDRLGAT
jgi:hypothetical protein